VENVCLFFEPAGFISSIGKEETGGLYKSSCYMAGHIPKSTFHKKMKEKKEGMESKE